jgi:cyanate lyase
LIHEEFDDGIMSAIHVDLDVERRPVHITLDGTFLPDARD